MEPFVNFARFWGLWPQSLRRSSPGISIPSLLWYFVIVAIYIYVIYINLDKKFWMSFIEVLNCDYQVYGTWLQILSSLMISLISILMTLFTFRKIWTLFEMIVDVDIILNKDFSLIVPKRVHRTINYITVIILHVIYLVLLCVTYYIFNLTLGLDSYIICIDYLLANIPYLASMISFYLTTNGISRRFHQVNCILLQLSPNDIPKDTFEVCSRSSKNDRHMPTIELNEIYSIYGNHLRKGSPMSPPIKPLRDKNEISREIKKLTTKLENREENLWTKIHRRRVIEIEEYKMVKLINPDDIIEHLTKLLDIHAVLLDCIGLQNQIISLQILLIVAEIFIFEVYAMFSIYRTFNNTAIRSIPLAYGNVFWVIFYSIMLYLIMSIATDCVKQGKNMGTCIHKVINKIGSHAHPKVIEKLSTMSHQITMRSPDFNCGLFSFDWELIFSIISATTIYLVFLLQFDIAKNANDAEKI
ncbi:CLUMA_CG011577, isoform A [Clunio marinus]|uniref:Gustatory receptor n=1 Tax=Clunio marinus TaxID=568069 RepID=A0A1J1IGP6_9DIPT|nr:CLUMA_CG011577, isoform A [Clunio marinus]